MPLSGYLNQFVPAVRSSVLFDATGLLDDERFWPAFLHSLGGSDTAVAAFDVDPADVEEMLELLHRHEAWPVIPLSLNAGHVLYILFRNFPGEGGWDYLLTGPEIEEPITAASLDGHFQGPAMSWTELVTAARRHDEGPGPAERLLLLLPAAVGDTDTPPEARDLVAAAVTAVGARDHQDTVAAELLAAHKRFWGTCTWRDREGIRLCAGGHSIRNPAEPREHLQSLSQAFASA